MPKLKLYGAAIDVGDLGPRQVRANPTTKAAIPPIDVAKFARNGSAASAQFQNLVNEASNYAALFRTKELAALGGILGTGGGVGVSSSASDRPRWRAAIHTGPLHHAIVARMVMHPQSAGFSSPSAAKIDIYSDATESTLVATKTMFYGASPTGSASLSGWAYLKWQDLYIEGLSADTTYFVKVTDLSYGLVQSVSIADLQSMTDGFDGLLPQSLNSDSEVLHVYRSLVSELQQSLWKRSGAKVLTWSVDSQASPVTRNSATAVNIIDGSSVLIDATTPGFYFDMTGKARLSQDTVPCMMYVYGWMSAGSNLGRVRIYDSTANLIGTVGGVWSTTPSWQSVAIDLPPTIEKYDIFLDNFGSNTFNLGALSIYEYET